MLEIIGIKSGRSLNFKCADAIDILHNQIYLSSGLVSKKAQPRLFPCIISLFQEIIYHHILKNSTSQRIIIQLFCLPDPEQIAQQSGIAEVQFRRFGQAFVYVCTPRRQHPYDIGCLQNTQPRIDRRNTDSGLHSKRRTIQFRTDTSGTQPEKFQKLT